MVLFRLLLICWLAFPLAAQEILDTPAGPLERKVLPNGSVFLAQQAPLPVVAVTLAHPWGRAHDPANGLGTVELLNRVVARDPATLLRLEEIGGSLSYSTGELWSSYTLLVPRSHLQWAVQQQLLRLEGPALKGSDWQGLGAVPEGMDSTALQTFVSTRWRAGETVLCVAGGYDGPALTKIMDAHYPITRAVTPVDTPKVPAAPRGRLAWRLPAPASPRARAAALVWQTVLSQQDSSVRLELDPGDAGPWLSVRCASPEETDRARVLLRQTLADVATLAPDAELVQASLLRHLQLWDDLPTRSRWLAVEQGRRQLESALALHQALRTYDAQGWNADLAFAAPQQVSEAAYVPDARSGVATTTSGTRVRPQTATALGKYLVPGAPPPFTRIEFSPQRGAIVQPINEVPLVSLCALVPGGAGRDASAQAGRAEWLGAYWQEALSARFPSSVETGPHGWQISSDVAPENAAAWVSHFLSLLQEPQLQPQHLTRAQLKLARRRSSALQQAYHAWLRMLYPADHPLGRQGELPAQVSQLTPARVQELANDVKANSQWNLFCSGRLSPHDVQRAVSSSAPPPSQGEWRAPGPTAVLEAPASPVVFEATVERGTLLIGGHGPSRRDADFYAFVLMLQVLAGDPLRSRLQTELRHKAGLAERIDCSFTSASETAPWLIRVDCDAAKLPAVLAIVRAQMQQLSTAEISGQELQRAVSRLEGLQQLATRNGSGRVEQLRNLEMFRLSDSYSQGFAGIYRGVGRKDVLQAAKVWLSRPLATLLVTPTKSSQTPASPEPAPGSGSAGWSPNRPVL